MIGQYSIRREWRLLTTKSVRNEAIRHLIASGQSLKEVAAQFNISIQRVSAICNAGPKRHDGAIEKQDNSIVNTIELLLKQSQELQSTALSLLAEV